MLCSAPLSPPKRGQLVGIKVRRQTAVIIPQLDSHHDSAEDAAGAAAADRAGRRAGGVLPTGGARWRLSSQQAHEKDQTQALHETLVCVQDVHLRNTPQMHE